jgi:uncharacterized membrane protein YadS
MIIPVVGVLGVLARRGDAGRTVHWHRVVAWLLVWFVVVAVLESVGMVPDAWRAPLASLAVGLITVALAAIGLSTNLGEMCRAGYGQLMLGTLTGMTVAITGLVLQFVVGSW